MFVDALTGPGTPQELAREHTYLEAFRALSMSAKADAAVRRRRRLRLAAVGGFAALAVTGTAAALTGTYPGAQPDPSGQSLPLRQSTASSSRPGTTTAQPGGGRTTSAPVAPTTGGGTDAPLASPLPLPLPSVSASASGSPSGSAEPTPTVSASPTVPPVSPNASPVPSPKPSPTPSTGQDVLPDPGTLVAYCQQYLHGKVKKGSLRWQVLVLAAGAESKVRSYCEDLVDGDDATTGAAGTAAPTD
jgi:hypothetical protein